MRKFFLATMCLLTFATPALANMVYQVSPGVSDGVLNIRRGPSASYTLLGVIPAGQMLEVVRCVPPQDTYSKADWCEVWYQNLHGWASTSGMMPFVPEPVAASTSFDMTCLNPSAFATASDPNPTRYVRIRGSGYQGQLSDVSVRHVMLNGEAYERLDQYNSNQKLYSDPKTDRYGWSGTWTKKPGYEMIGIFSFTDYTETQTKFGKPQFVMSFPCKPTNR